MHFKNETQLLHFHLITNREEIEDYVHNNKYIYTTRKCSITYKLKIKMHFI